MDGLGGTVKRAVWRHIRSGHAHVSNPEEYAAVAQQRNPNIYIEFVSESSIKDVFFFGCKMGRCEGSTLDAQKALLLSPSSQLIVAETSDAIEFKVVSIYKSRTTNYENHSLGSDSDSESDSGQSDAEAPQDEALEVSITVGQWVVVKYDEARYPGEVASVDEDSQYEVSVMHGNNWKWPKTEDKIYYPYDSIVQLLDTVDSLFLMNKYRNIVYEIVIMIIVL